MKKYKYLIIALNLVLLLVYFNHSIRKKENLLMDGQLVLLELAPADPRSLMQGDYMALRYKISERTYLEDAPARRGYCVVRLNADGVAERQRFQEGLTPLYEGEHLIRYTMPDGWRMQIGAESFFFQEGDAPKYEKAKYGGIKIDRKGNSLLVGLYDEAFRKIE